MKLAHTESPDVQYDVRSVPGANNPIGLGGLYDITLGGRLPPPPDTKTQTPGPGQYNLKGPFDQYNVTPGYKGLGHSEEHGREHSASSVGCAGGHAGGKLPLQRAGHSLLHSSSMPQVQ